MSSNTIKVERYLFFNFVKFCFCGHNVVVFCSTILYPVLVYCLKHLLKSTCHAWYLYKTHVENVKCQQVTVEYFKDICYDFKTIAGC